MTEENPYAPHLFDPRPLPGDALPYPTQSKKTPTDQEQSLAGELRGYYGPPQFNPCASRFGKVRNNGKTSHWGVDIYAPYTPFPNEVAVHAICKGRVVFVFDNESPDDLGNRVWLYPEHAPSDRVILGHLNRFVGHDRRVQKGELLGFSGCSGNANEEGECTARGDLNINSGHVHLSYRPRSSGVADPLDKLGWSLRFDDIDNPIPLAKWKSDGHLLDAPAAPDFTPGKLKADSKPSERIGKTAEPSKLSAPFAMIDFDNKEAVEATARFYRLAYTRLEANEFEHPKTRFHRHGIDQFRKSITDAAVLLERLVNIERQLGAISQEPDTPATLLSRTQRAQTRTAEYLFNCMRLLWLAMAGEALLLVAKSPGKLHDKKKGEKDPVPGGWPGVVPRSGIGLCGKSILVSLGNGQSALHASFLKKLDDNAANPGTKKVVAYSDWTLSVSFGAGTPWHAVLDQKFAEEADGMFRDYSSAIVQYTYMVSALSKVTFDKSSVVDSASLKRYLTSIRTMMGAIAGEGEDAGVANKLFAALDKIGEADATILSLLKTIAKTSGDAADQASICLDSKVRQIDRIRSGYEMIWIEPTG